ncbi:MULTISPECIES: hypothetical protein [Fusobacterium]|uniref:Uncharacterized protein n=1 Tax=Fusobacterium nucleatum TaxID=851 RepID=A0A133NQU7_FUSNU|nr:MULTISPECIES: hypothetical protein [Fusobacterium]EUB30957.1 hypothetical protein HMPREF1501_2468 [Fusobacterium sp. OBRC1]KXA18651.1 hypothetical protein HMPREF3221_01702 [Fusobacterium nucleatum]
MSESIKINMPFAKWCEVQKEFEEVNKVLPNEDKLDFEKYKYCSSYGRLLCHLYLIKAGTNKTLKEPEFYNKKEFEQ